MPPPVGIPAGSIPACAGEPSRFTRTALQAEVYPRVCGGTAEGNPLQTQARGLSPRVRGNRGGSGRVAAKLGAIPACAGEPLIIEHIPPSIMVYPRVCGGTPTPNPANLPASGLSPRVRGNPLLGVADSQSLRSIPACAGEPS